MGEWSFQWSDEFSCGDNKIDSAHKEILEKGGLLHKKIFNGGYDEFEVLNLALKLADKIIEHMYFEIDLMKELGLENWQKHEENHISYKKKFDLEQNHKLSDKMRILMIAGMTRDYMENHFLIFDIPDLRKIKERLEIND